MSDENPYTGPRWVAFAMAGIAAVTLIAALLSAPLAEWSTSNYLLGAILIVFIIVFARAGIIGKLNLVGQLKGKTTLIISIIGAIASVVSIFIAVLPGEINLDSILTAGTWLALLVMFGSSIAVARKKMNAGQ